MLDNDSIEMEIEQGLYLEECPGLEQGLSQGLVEVEVESVVGVDVVSDPGTV